jgi:hypothetical protein
VQRLTESTLVAFEVSTTGSSSSLRGTAGAISAPCQLRCMQPGPAAGLCSALLALGGSRPTYQLAGHPQPLEGQPGAETPRVRLERGQAERTHGAAKDGIPLPRREACDPAAADQHRHV